MQRTARWLLALVVLGAAGYAGDVAQAQPLGTFRWQLQPFCNVVTLTVTQQSGIYTLDGFDELCGAAARAAASGIAFPNPDGTIGLGLTVVLAPGGTALHIDATIDLATVSGTWHDSAGNAGPFVFNPAIAPGSPRPPPIPVFASGLAAGNTPITDVGAPVSATDAATKGYVDAGDAASRAFAVALLAGTSLPQASQFTFQNDGGFVARGTFNVGVIPAEGAGARLMWHPNKAAFRAGSVFGAQWNDANVGDYSVALGNATTASGFASTALGGFNTASGGFSTALGNQSTASGFASTAMGDSSASGSYSTAIGQATASGDRSTAIGSVTASGAGSIAMGDDAFAEHEGSFVFGDRSAGLFVPGLHTSTDNQFSVRAAGGVRFFTTVDTAPPAAGVQLAAGASSWTTLSDVRSKHHFRDLDGEAVLAKLAAMPIREWSYKAQDPAIRHVGPTAQDFHAAFGLGEDPLGISTIDADGIALRAIQALEARTRALHEENAALGAELAELRSALATAAVRR